MLILPATMLQALGYCVPDDWGIWPPTGSWLPPEPELMVYDGAPSFDRAVFSKGGERVPAVTVEDGWGRWRLWPERPLSPGTWRLGRKGSGWRWEVRDVSVAAPWWAGEATVHELLAFYPICPSGPFVKLDVPVAGTLRQPRVEITFTNTAQPGESWTSTFEVHDDEVDLHRGCAPAAPMPPGETVSLSIVPVNSEGVRGPAKEIRFRVEDVQ